MVDLNPESKRLIMEYVKRGLINKSKIHDLWVGIDEADLANALRSFVEIDDAKEEVVWRYVRKVVWQGVNDKEDEKTMFNTDEMWFFELLLRNKGILSYKAVLDNFPSPYRAKNSYSKLLNMEDENKKDISIVDKITLTNNEVFLLLNLDFYKRCFE